jgi:tetratricopeptide (TPR) repeat protein
MILKSKLIPLSFTLEGAALAALGVGGRFDLAAFLLFHLGASVSLALFVYPFLPRQYRRPRLPSLGFLTAFSFFVPVLAFGGLLLAAVLARFIERPMKHHPFARVVLPEFADGAAAEQGGFGLGGVAARLRHATGNPDARMKALLAVQAMPARLSNPLLQEMLSDSEDDIRLLAYGMLDAKEKDINRRIHERLRELPAAAPRRVAMLRKELAELYWELAYQGLAQGDLLDYVLGEARMHAEAARQQDTADNDSLVLLGKLAMRQGRVEEANGHFSAALANGVPHVRVLPYLAELAYRERDFDTTRRLLAQLPGNEQSSALEQVANYWMSGVANRAPGAA